MLFGGFDDRQTDRQTDEQTDIGGCRVAFATEKHFISGLVSDLNPISSCMTDPTSSTCTSTYSGASTLPSVLSGRIFRNLILMVQI